MNGHMYNYLVEHANVISLQNNLIFRSILVTRNKLLHIISGQKARAAFAMWFYLGEDLLENIFFIQPDTGFDLCLCENKRQ